MYEYSFRVRYSECDRTGHLSLMGLLGLFQDGGYLHAHDRGLGIEHSAKTEQTWYLLTWNIYADKMPPLSAYCTLSTWFYESHGVFARKNILLRDEKGEVLAKGDTLWVHMDTKNGVPVPPPEGQFPPEDYGEKWEMDYKPRRIPVPKGAHVLPCVTVSADDVDTNHHVNNFRYAQMAHRALGAPEGCRGIQVEYVRQAYLGDTLTPLRAETEEGTVLSFQNAHGLTCATFLFRR